MANSLLEAMKNKEFQEAKGVLQEESNTRALIAGATPLLVGLLGGFKGDSAEIASKALMAEDQRALKEEKSLFDILRAERKAASGGKDRLHQVRDPKTGDITYQYTSEAHGQLAPHKRRSLGESELLAGKTTTAREEAKKAGGVYGRKLKSDPQGRDRVVDIATGEAGAPVFEDVEAGISPRFEKIRDARYTKLSSRNAKDFEGFRTAVKGMRLAMTKGTMPKAVALNMIPKITEARATDEDYNRVIEHVARTRRLLEIARTEKDGKLAARKIKEAKTVFETLMGITQDILKKDVAKSAKAISSSDAEFQNALKNFGDLVPNLSVPRSSGKITVRKGNEVYNIDPKDLKAAQKDGFRRVE